MNAAIALLASATLLCACRSTSTSSTPTREGIPFRTIARGYQSGLAGEGVTVARDVDAWRAMWNRHTSTELPRPELPQVDFQRDMVVCVLLGQRPTFGYSIEIETLTEDAQKALLVATRDTHPAKDAILNQVITQPFHMITTARRDGDVKLAPR